MEKRVDHSIEVIWDGIREYEAYKKEYDYSGAQHGMTGIEYCLIHVLCKGDRFCKHAEATVRKAFGLDDSPRYNSLHDAEFYHPLYGWCNMETRCLMGASSTSYSSEIGGGGRSATEKTEASGGKTFKEAHERSLHKLHNTTFFAFCDIKFMPRLRISIIKSDTLLDLWRRGIYTCRAKGREGYIPQSITRDLFYKMCYGQSNPNVEIVWEKRNPWDLSQQRQNENISVFDNECGYEETLKKFDIKKQQKINIDKEIGEHPEIYSEVAEIKTSKKKHTEIIDIMRYLEI